MNDRFKFRVWDTENKEYHSMDNFINKDGELGCVDWTVGFIEYKDGLHTIEQCTGLKDKNGNLIYEGDIVKAFGFKNCYKLVCRFRDSSFCLDHIDGSPYNFVHSVSPIEIIGNIHENADLIKVSGK